MKNRVRAARTKLGFSQRALAELVGTSQQQIQRIETGKVAARLELATKLAAALKTPLPALFPGSAKPLRKAVEAYEARREPDEDVVSELANVGIETDVRAWFFRIRLRGHKQNQTFQVAPDQQRWLFRKVQDEDATGNQLTFVVFDTAEERIAINASELVYCHFMYELAAFVKEEKNDPGLTVEVFLAGNEQPLTFGVEPDSGSPDDEEDEGQFRGIFFDLETYADETGRVYFEDEDGEDVFLRAGDIALLKVPLLVVDSEYDPDEEFEDAPT